MGLFIGALLIGELLTGLAELRKRAVFENLFTSAVADRFFATLVVAAALTLLYKFIPNAPVSWPSAAIAAVIVALLLRVIKLGFTLYFKIFPTINIIYEVALPRPAAADRPLPLLGARARWRRVDLRARRRPHRDADPRGEGRAELAVRLLLRAAKAPVRLEELQRELGRPSAELDALADQLRESGLLEGARDEAFHVAQPLGRIPLSRVLAAVSPISSLWVPRGPIASRGSCAERSGSSPRSAISS